MKTAEEIFQKWNDIYHSGSGSGNAHDHHIKAMEEYAAQFTQPPYGREVWVEVPVSERLPVTKEKIGQYFLTRTEERGDYLCNTWFDKASNSFGTFPVTHWLERTALPAQVEGEWHSKFSGNVETDQHKIWEHILKLWSEHKDTTFDFICEMEDKFTLIQNYAHDYKLENTLPAPQGYTKSQMGDCWDKAVEWRNGIIYSGAVSNPYPDKDTYLASLSPAPEQGDAVHWTKMIYLIDFLRQKTSKEFYSANAEDMVKQYLSTLK